MPGTVSEVRGVLNLRGVVVPIVDMRLRFNLGEASFTRETVIIVTLIQQRAVGLVVDSVSDVISLTEGQFKPSPKVEGFDAHHMKGIAALADGMVILLNADNLLSAEALEIS
jgi:purine-binding chemotaxis protein CheW